MENLSSKMNSLDELIILVFKYLFVGKIIIRTDSGPMERGQQERQHESVL